MGFGDPRLPRETCPTIDKVISLMEEVREANAELRGCAEHYREKADGLEDCLDKANRRIEELEAELKEAIDAARPGEIAHGDALAAAEKGVSKS